jgi:hypothetical protein
MEIVNFLAELWGASIIIVALALLINPKNIKTLFHLAEDDRMLLLVGMINVVLGIALVLTYNTWDYSWKTIITALGWAVILRGSLILFFNDLVKEVVGLLRKHQHALPAILVIATIFGCYLIYAGAVL